ncbi:hypothetical protein [Vulgatibacter incomptus]|uniref:Uncharacterized protein n=1 Tax=Vulgatibacter incomptus TaxID=1391653 RepID=A0A0K1P7Y1_9BACT|nr:hypothetical protein [Vulgatibacter incomptus]AKU89617.1 hypothetical protein AKJ08_0004 [Vulgatibacter incomptus]
MDGPGDQSCLQAAVHVLFYGVPLATWLSLRIRELEVPGVHELRHRYQTSTGAEQEFRIERDEEELGIRMPPPQLPPPERRPPAR